MEQLQSASYAPDFTFSSLWTATVIVILPLPWQDCCWAPPPASSHDDSDDDTHDDGSDDGDSGDDSDHRLSETRLVRHSDLTALPKN